MERVWRKIYRPGRRVKVAFYDGLSAWLYNGEICDGCIFDINGCPIGEEYPFPLHEHYLKKDYLNGCLIKVRLDLLDPEYKRRADGILLLPFWLITPVFAMKECNMKDLVCLYEQVVQPEAYRNLVPVKDDGEIVYTEQIDFTNKLNVDKHELYEYADGYYKGLISDFGTDIRKWSKHNNSDNWVEYCLKRLESA